MVVDAVTDRYRPLPFDQEKLVGLIARRLRANSEGYLEHVDRQLAPTTAHAAVTPERSFGEQAGKFLEASANAYEYRHDERLKAVMDRVDKEVIAAQSTHQHLGYHLGDVDSRSRDLVVHKYDLLGLLAYYRVTQSEESLAAARKIGELLVTTFSKDSTDGAGRADAASLIEPLVALYAYTEESHYLDLCRSAAEAWLKSRGRHSETTAENLSILHGLIELYRVTGDESYFRDIPATWMQVRSSGLSLAGSPLSSGESRGASAGKNPEDACATLAWIQLTLNLLRITGEPQYAEQLEQTFYNGVFAAQDANTGAILSPAPLNGTKQPAPNADPCVSSQAQSITLAPAAVWGRYGNGIAVLLYNAGRATFQLRRRGAVQLYSEANFPESGDFLLHVEPAHNMHFPLRLRVPEWTNRFTVDIGGSHLNGKPGDYLTLNREWRPGDTIKISIDMTPRVISSPESPDQIAVQRGPQVLALSKALNPQLKDLAEAAIPAGGGSETKLPSFSGRLPMNWPGDQAYDVMGEYGGKSQPFVLTPFADARSYRVWLKGASASSGAAKYLP